MTIPAMAPPDRALRCSGARSPESLVGARDGVEVTVRVTMAPDTVTTWTLVTGVGVWVGVGAWLEGSVVTGMGTATGAVMLLLAVDEDEVVVASVVVGVCHCFTVSTAHWAGLVDKESSLEQVAQRCA